MSFEENMKDNMTKCLQKKIMQHYDGNMNEFLRAVAHTNYLANTKRSLKTTMDA